MANFFFFKIKVLLFMCFEQKYINEKSLLILIVQHYTISKEVSIVNKGRRHRFRAWASSKRCFNVIVSSYDCSQKIGPGKDVYLACKDMKFKREPKQGGVRHQIQIYLSRLIHNISLIIYELSGSLTCLSLIYLHTHIYKHLSDLSVI